MNNTDKPQEPDGVTSSIVRIAYRQSRAMSNSESSDDSAKQPKGLACANRLKSLPVIASINSSISGAYTSVKSSHSTVETILNHTEEGLSEGVKIVSPVTAKIGETLEQPLKSIDDAVCNGLDYLEKNLPSVKLPPGEIYENVKEYMKNISDTVKKQSKELTDDVKVRLDGLTRVIEGDGEKTETPRHDRKSDD